MPAPDLFASMTGLCIGLLGGEQILYCRADLSIQITGMFDRHGLGENQNLGNVMQATIALADIAPMLVNETTKEPLAGDFLLISGVKYLVTDSLVDGGGAAKLTITRA